MLLNDTIQFFKKEKAYGVLFLILVALYGYLLVAPRPERESGRPSPALDEYRKAEERLEQKVKKAGSFRDYLEERPMLGILFKLLTFLAAGSFSLGLVIDFFLMFNAPWRRSLSCHGPPHTTEWKISMLFKVIVLFLLGTFLLSFMFEIVLYLFRRRASENIFVLLHTTAADFLCVAFILYVVREAGGRWRDLGLGMPEGEFWKETLLGLGGYLAVLPAFIATLVFLVYLTRLFAYEPPPHPLVNVFLEEEERSPMLIVYSVFLATVVGPMLEEIFFRGFCYPIFKKRFGIAWGMVITSAFFALIHENSFAFWPIFILGMGLAYVYEKRGSLAAPMALHIAHNAVFITYFFLAKNIVVREAGL